MDAAEIPELGGALRTILSKSALGTVLFVAILRSVGTDGCFFCRNVIGNTLVKAEIRFWDSNSTTRGDKIGVWTINLLSTPKIALNVTSLSFWARASLIVMPRPVRVGELKSSSIWTSSGFAGTLTASASAASLREIKTSQSWLTLSL